MGCDAYLGYGNLGFGFFNATSLLEVPGIEAAWYVVGH